MKQTRTPAQILDAAIENSLISAKPGEGIDAQAKRVISEQKEQIDALTPDWQLREVLRGFRLKRLELARRRRAEDQYLLPGFDRLPQRITIRDGKTRPLDKATYRQLRDYFEVLRKRERYSPKILQVKTLMERLWPYAKETPGITVREVCVKEAAKK